MDPWQHRNDDDEPWLFSSSRNDLEYFGALMICCTFSESIRLRRRVRFFRRPCAKHPGTMSGGQTPQKLKPLKGHSHFVLTILN